MKCPRCDATGKIQKKICYYCQGYRYVTCILCRGKKEIDDKKQLQIRSLQAKCLMLSVFPVAIGMAGYCHKQ
jgi:DnaJ-class molecular chaperone